MHCCAPNRHLVQSKAIHCNNVLQWRMRLQLNHVKKTSIVSETMTSIEENGKVTIDWNEKVKLLEERIEKQEVDLAVAEKNVREARKSMSDLRSQRADALKQLDRAKQKQKVEVAVAASESKLRQRSRERHDDAATTTTTTTTTTASEPIPANEDIDDKDRHIVVRDGLLIGPDDRFRIKSCIGEGTFGKVVSAQDRQHGDREIAIKIVRTIDKYRDAARAEIKVLRTVARFDPDDKSSCVRLTDSFEWRGHVCMIFPRYGLSLYDFLKKNNYKPFRPTEVAMFGVQLCLAVAFLHDLTIVHTDLKPENILLVRSDTNGEKSRPRDLYLTDSSKDGPRQVPISFSVKLIDFGSATFNERYHSTVVATRHYRAPEVLLELGWSYPCDLWAIGAILLELYTGDALFQVHDNHEHLAMIERALRKPFPTHMVRAAAQANPSNTSKFFNSRHELRPLDSGSSASRRVRDMLTPHEIFRDANDQQRDLYDLLMHLLHYDPQSRWRAREALSHRFFDKVRLQRPPLEQFSQRRTYEEIVAVMDNNAELKGVGGDAERKQAKQDGDRPSERRKREREQKRDAKRDGDGEGAAATTAAVDNSKETVPSSGNGTSNNGADSRNAPEKRAADDMAGKAKRRRAGDVDDSAAAAHDDASLANENHTPVSEMIEF